MCSLDCGNHFRLYPYIETSHRTQYTQSFICPLYLDDLWGNGFVLRVLCEVASPAFLMPHPDTGKVHVYGLRKERVVFGK